MKYTTDGRIDLSGIVVRAYEVAYARYHHFGQDPKRSDAAIRYCIALGKACGSYDPLPAHRWWHEQVDATRRTKVKSDTMLSLNDNELDRLYAAIVAEQSKRKAKAIV